MLISALILFYSVFCSCSLIFVWLFDVRARYTLVMDSVLNRSLLMAETNHTLTLHTGYSDQGDSHHSIVIDKSSFLLIFCLFCFLCSRLSQYR